MLQAPLFLRGYFHLFHFIDARLSYRSHVPLTLDKIREREEKKNLLSE